jgi:hypothetical protein
MIDGPSRWVLQGSAVGPLSQDTLLRRDGWCSADLVVARVAAWLPQLEMVQRYNAECGLNTKRHSAYIKFASGLNIDISPVLWAVFSNSIDRYYMPVGNGSNFWKATNPKEDQRRVSEINQQKGGLLLPSIRMLKWWNTNMNAGRLKGIHLEVMAEQAVTGRAVSGIAEALHLQFASIASQLDPACSDPTGLGDALDKNLSWQDRQASKTAASNAHNAANLAGVYYSIGLSDLGRASWQQVFPAI